MNKIVGFFSAPLLFLLLLTSPAFAQVPPPVSITTTSLPSGTIGTAVSETLQASGGVAPYTWSAATNLPIGVTLDPSGAISGTPLMPANSPWSFPLPTDYSFTAQVQDLVGQMATATIAWTINPTITYSRTPSGPGPLPGSATIHIHVGPGSGICRDLASRNGYGRLAFLSGGDQDITLPPGTYTNLQALCSDYDQHIFDPGTFTVASAPTISTNPLLQPGIVGQSYSATLQYTLSSGYQTVPETPYTWSVTSGSLPDGLSLDASTGVLSGTPTAAATSTFTVQIEDGIGQIDTKVMTMYTFVPISIAPPSLPDASVGVSYSQSLEAADGTAPYVWAIQSGSLPDGLMLNSSGLISGTPTSPGTYDFVVRVTDANTVSSKKSFSINVSSNSPPVLTPIGNQTVLEGQTLQFTVSATDPDGDTLAYSASNLPPGATFNPVTHTFTWTPNYGQAGNYTNVEFTVTDSGTPMQLADQLITISVGHVNRPPVFTAVGPQQASTTIPLSFTVHATDPDGDAVILSAVDVPVGATFYPNTGVFSWTPAYNQSGVYTVTFTATDNGLPAMATSSIDAVISVSESSPTTLTQNLVDTITSSNLPTNQQNAYMANLRKVTIFVNDGKTNQAINQLNAFIQKLNQDYAQGKLTQTQYDAYLGQAQIIISDLQ